MQAPSLLEPRAPSEAARVWHAFLDEHVVQTLQIIPSVFKFQASVVHDVCEAPGNLVSVLVTESGVQLVGDDAPGPGGGHRVNKVLPATISTVVIVHVYERRHVGDNGADASTTSLVLLRRDRRTKVCEKMWRLIFRSLISWG